MFSALREGRYSFATGGYVEFYDRFSDRWNKFSEFHKEGSQIELIGRKSGENLDASHLVTLWQPKSLLERRTRFGGALELLLTSQLGHSCHIPWYAKCCEAEQIGIEMHEYISPLSVADPTRVSTTMGGRGNRLSPSGYTLLDYGGGAVYAFVQGMFGGAIDEHLTEDLLYLCDNFPVVSEKVSEDQAPSRVFVETLVRMVQESISGRTAGNYDDQGDRGSSNELISLIALLKQLASAGLSDSPAMAPSGVRFTKLGESKGWEKMSASTLLDCCAEVFGSRLEWLRGRGLSVQVFNRLQKDLLKNRAGVDTAELSWEKGRISREQHRKIKYFCRSMIEIAIQYFGYLAFMAGGALKANVFVLGLLLNGPEMKNAITSIMERRGVVKRSFRVALFEGPK